MLADNGGGDRGATSAVGSGRADVDRSRSDDAGAGQPASVGRSRPDRAGRDGARDGGRALGEAVARIVAAAYAVSPALRQAGQAAVTKILFDDMLAHIDPYSRYVPPMEAVGDRDRRVGHAGIGVSLIQHGKAVSVRDVVIGSPGALAGMRPGTSSNGRWPHRPGP